MDLYPGKRVVSSASFLEQHALWIKASEAIKKEIKDAKRSTKIRLNIKEIQVSEYDNIFCASS